MQIRQAIITDIKSVHKLLNHYAGKGLLLPRSLSELYEHLRDYLVLTDDTTEKNVIGVCGLRICWEDLAEIKSLAVSDEFHGRGMGTRLVRKCLDEAQALRLDHVFTLTYAPGFFKRLGFETVEKSELPNKIWGDCLNCPKFPNCDETALMMDL